jgi:hypothetical protein
MHTPIIKILKCVSHNTYKIYVEKEIRKTDTILLQGLQNYYHMKENMGYIAAVSVSISI